MKQTNSMDNDDPPLVTAVITYYERPELLKRAIRSVIDQSYSPIELIIVDDCSQTHPANPVIEKSNLCIGEPNDVSVHRHCSNQGASESRNTGIRQASGQYIAFLDDDDTWKPQKIEKQVQVASNKETVLVYCGIQRVGPNGTTRSTYRPEKDGDVAEDLLAGNFTGTASTVLVSRQVAQEVNGFDQQFLRWNDWDFVLRVAKKGQFRFVPDLLVKQYNSEADQLSGDHEKLKTSADRLREKHIDFAESLNRKGFFTSWIKWGLGHSAMNNNQFAEARSHFVSSLRYDPLNKKAYVYLLVVSGGSTTYQLAKRINRFVAKALSR